MQDACSSLHGDMHASLPCCSLPWSRVLSCLPAAHSCTCVPLQPASLCLAWPPTCHVLPVVLQAVNPALPHESVQRRARPAVEVTHDQGSNMSRLVLRHSSCYQHLQAPQQQHQQQYQGDRTVVTAFCRCNPVSAAQVHGWERTGAQQRDTIGQPSNKSPHTPASGAAAAAAARA